MYRAILAAPTDADIPNIEFVFSVEDLPAQPTKPMWSLARRAQDHNLWLIPDFGFWSWDMPAIGTLDEVANEAVQRESIEPWDQKSEKLVWRGKITFAPKLRRALLDAAKGKPWSDVGQLKWTDPNFKEQFLGPVDQCNYMFIAHAEGTCCAGLCCSMKLLTSIRTQLLRLAQVPPTLPFRHRLAQTAVDSTLPLPFPEQRYKSEFCRSRTRLF